MGDKRFRVINPGSIKCYSSSSIALVATVVGRETSFFNILPASVEVVVRISMDDSSEASTASGPTIYKLLLFNISDVSAITLTLDL